MLSRRAFLTAIAAGAVTGVAACSGESEAELPPPGDSHAGLAASKAAETTTTSSLPPIQKVALPTDGPLMSLPAAAGNVMALTVDDGSSPAVIRAYGQFARDSGVRVTFFVNGIYDGWTEHAALLRPMVESGQIQLANHTWSHPDLRKLSADGVIDQLRRNDTFLQNTYGITGTPFFRPPYGFHNAAVDSAAASIGYLCPALWNGSFGDSSVVTTDHIVRMANQYFHPGAIVIGHANHDPVTKVFSELVDVIEQRQLRTVTLNDVFEYTNAD